jgi:TolB-like protein
MRFSRSGAVALLIAQVSFAAAPTSSETPSLVVLQLQAGGVDASVATSLTENITSEVAQLKLFKVISATELQTLLGLERQKALLGCTEASTSCMSELADAMGARFVVSGTVTRLGEALQLNLQALDTRRSQAVGRSTRIATSLEVLRAQLPFAVAEVVGAPPPQRPSRVPGVLMLASGGAGVVVGGVLWLQSLTREEVVLNELKLANQPNVTLSPASTYRDEVRAISELRVAGSVIAGVGAALAVAGFFVLPGDNDVVRVSVVPTANGVGFAGVFP